MTLFCLVFFLWNILYEKTGRQFQFSEVSVTVSCSCISGRTVMICLIFYDINASQLYRPPTQHEIHDEQLIWCWNKP